MFLYLCVHISLYYIYLKIDIYIFLYMCTHKYTHIYILESEAISLYNFF